MVSKKWSFRVAAVILSVSLALVGCGTGSTKTTSTGADAKSGEKVTIRINMGDGEITKDQITAFNKDHSNINLERVDTDFNKLMGYIAANSEITPDIIRVNGGNEFPFYAARGLALDLQPNFDTSSVFKKDDLLSVSDIFKWNGQNQGVGDLYGFVKDWSPENDLYINKKLFTEAGIPIPDDKTVLTWDQIMEYSKKLTKKDGDKVTQWGYMNPFVGGIKLSQSQLLSMLASSGKSLYSADFGTILLDTPEAKKALQYWVDLTKAGVGPSPVTPDATSWVDLFTQGKMGMMTVGYWFGGLIKAGEASKTHLDDFKLLPSPMVAGGKAIESVQFGTGAIIYSKTKHPKEAWTVFEWFFGGKPADERAASGWGLPGFQSKMILVPTATNFDKQIKAVVSDNISHLTTIPNNPYISTTAIDTILDKYFTPVYFGKDTLDGAIEKSKKEIEIQIRENKDIVGVK